MSRTSSTRSRWTLTKLWLVWSGVLFATLLYQSMTGYFGSRLTDAWGWFVPLVSPTLAAIVGVLVAEQKAGKSSSFRVDNSLYQISYWLSVGYLTVISLTIYMAPVAWNLSGVTPVELMKLSQLWILPIQALVAASLGAVFVSGSARS